MEGAEPSQTIDDLWIKKNRPYNIFSPCSFRTFPYENEHLADVANNHLYITTEKKLSSYKGGR